jgi:hypothetical protein
LLNIIKTILEGLSVACLPFIFLLLSFIFSIMAGPKGSKYYNIFLKQQLQLVTRDDDTIISEEGFTLLAEIKKEQSIVATGKHGDYCGK